MDYDEKFDRQLILLLEENAKKPGYVPNILTDVNMTLLDYLKLKYGIKI